MSDQIKKLAPLIWSKIQKSNNIAITSHLSPDDDSIGSVLSFFHFLNQIVPKKSIRMLYSGDKPDRYSYFSNYSDIEFVEDIATNLSGVDCLVMLDGSQYSRFTYKPQLIKEFPGKTICIDHHQSPIDKFSISLIDTNATSTSELVYRIFSDKAKLNAKVGESLLLGILGDTGNFSYIKPTQLEIFTIVKKLLDITKIELQDFMSRFNTISPKVFLGVRELVNNNKFNEVQNWPNFSSTIMSRKFAEENRFDDNEVSDSAHIYLSHYCRLITGYKWGIAITPKSDGSCSMSLRSLPGSVSVRRIVERMGIGGGHDRAAGSAYTPIKGKKLEPEDCYGKFLVWLNQNPPESSDFDQP